MRYAVLDVEWPNNKQNRISAIGITIVEDNTITDHYYTLVNPEAKFDWYIKKNVTGIKEKDVSSAPTFAELWPVIEPYLSSGILVAHNAVFDLGVLKRCLKDYLISWKKETQYLCTYKLARVIVPDAPKPGIEGLCDYYNIEHGQLHNAGEDSKACANILLKYLGTGKDLTPYIQTYDLVGKDKKAKRRRRYFPKNRRKNIRKKRPEK